ncbi:hypothetical protein PC116_g33685 [Phytophthora cactorum]|nr:hypothetical protein PC116_g33685 [Phytophthora cactorum]
MAQVQQAAIGGGRGVPAGRGPMQGIPGNMVIPGGPGGIPGYPPNARQGGPAGRGGQNQRNGQGGQFPPQGGRGASTQQVSGAPNVQQQDLTPTSLLHSQLQAQSNNPQQQKQMLGELIFPKIQAIQPDLAGKITGMLLEMDNAELVNL